LEQQTNLDKLAHFGRLAQELAHEIKQPLTAINARAYTLQKLLPPGTDTQKDALVIRNEIKRLDRIVKDFLELARPAEPRFVPLSADQALEEIRDLMGSQLEQESIILKVDCEEELQFLGDPQQLKQVLINLVRNAAETLDAGGTITLRSRKATHALHGENREAAILEVVDTGPGIPPEIQPLIFDPFFSTKNDGTGLGLAIAAGIVDKHGGNLEFDTEPGKGTSFRILLPRVDPEPAPLGDSTVVSTLLGGTETILLVEDQDEVRACTAQILRGLGYTVLESSGPAQAVALAQESGGIDLLLSDVVMPGMGGRLG